MEDVISYPPYPSLYATGETVYRHLLSLAAWAEENRGYLLPRIPDTAHERLVKPSVPATSQYWANAAVGHQYNVLMTIRQVRELWDKAYREFEDVWDSQPALKFRFSVVALACDCLATAFVSGEQQEAQHTAASERISREREALHRGFGKIIKTEIGDAPASDDPYAGWGDELPEEGGDEQS